MGRSLSKSQILSARQCARRLWLQTHEPVRDKEGAPSARIAVGRQVGQIARSIYAPDGKANLVDSSQGVEAALAASAQLIASGGALFEAGFSGGDATAFADILVPAEGGWRMVEVKSSASLKDHHRPDLAVQVYAARQAGLTIVSSAVAHIDSTWIYKGDGDYRGLLKERDLTADADALANQVPGWVAEANAAMSSPAAPAALSGRQCQDPYPCEFYERCRASEPQAAHPVEWLPGHKSKALKDHLARTGAIELADAPDEMLSAAQLRVKQATLSGATFFDAQGACADLAAYAEPLLFLDFESTNLAVPIWPGTRPFQQICFQFSLHRLEEGKLRHEAFLDLSGDDPSRAFAEALIKACGAEGPIFVYHITFERSRVLELAKRFADLTDDLTALSDRMVDLLPIAKAHYYHPSQEGSWSIKKLLPAIAPDLSYQALDGVKDGAMAMEAFAEAIDSATSPQRRDEIGAQLLAYCELDTLAMVRVWAFLSGVELSL